MAEVEKSTAGNSAVPAHGDHDRVQMLSLRADGTPDQHNPELIGDREFALEATRRQFKEQAVSAVDSAERAAIAGAEAQTVGQDPQIEHLQQVHESAEKAAESAADATVAALHQGDAEPAKKTATSAAEKKAPGGRR